MLYAARTLWHHSAAVHALPRAASAVLCLLVMLCGSSSTCLLHIYDTSAMLPLHDYYTYTVYALHVR